MSHHAALILTFFLLAAGCTTSIGIESRVTESDITAVCSQSSLDNWLDTELLPYLSAELSRNPRLAGRPLLIAGFDGEEIKSEIDGLTEELRTRLKNGLIKIRGINLVWRHYRQPWQHHRFLREARCVDLTPPEIYLVIDCRQLPVNGELQVGIRALDLREEMWVPGFGASWTGKATPEQLSAFSRRTVDTNLRGLRPLPFTEDQADLAAAYLARNLSCLYQGVEEDIRIYQEIIRTAAIVDRVFGLLDEYLNLYMEAEITEQKDEASIVMRQEIKPITNGLYQVWIHSILKKNGRRLPGLDTMVYLTIRHRIRLHGFLKHEGKIMPATEKWNLSSKKEKETDA